VLFYLDRADMLSGAAKLPRTISEYFRQHVYVTPSGLFSHRYLHWALEMLGAEHILFATDYPFAHAARGSARNFIATAQLSERDRNMIASENWDRLCSKIVR
jgi:predicted TIM-barrel fold metal-dependent hydrolase